MPDRRAETRLQLTNTPALVIDRDSLCSFAVTVSDFSAAGCSVVSARIMELPVEVSLQIKGSGEVIPGRVVWRQSNRAGIEFDLDAAAGGEVGERSNASTIPATVRNLKGGVSLRCTIEEATRTTCRIASDAIDQLHDDIAIMIDEKRVALEGRIVWRAEGCAGVRLRRISTRKRPRPSAAAKMPL